MAVRAQVQRGTSLSRPTGERRHGARGLALGLHCLVFLSNLLTGNVAGRRGGGRLWVSGGVEPVLRTSRAARQVFVLLLACLLLWSPSSWAEPSGGEGSSTPVGATAGPDLTRPGKVTVGAKELVRELSPGVEVRFAPGSEVVVGLTSRVKLNGSRENSTKLFSFELLTGRVALNVPAGGSPKAPPDATVLIRGPGKVSALPMSGRAVVIVRGQEITIASLSGELLAASGNDWKGLPSGTSRTYLSGRQGATSSLLGELSFDVAPRLLMAAKADPGTAEVILKAVPGAASYRVELWELGEKKSRIRKDQYLGSATRVKFSGLIPGRYSISAVALTASGLEGKSGAEQEIRVIGIELPPGARQVDGALMLLSHQRVRLLEGEGLRMTYGDEATYFVQAPRDFGLGRLRETIVRFRPAEGSGEARLVLRRRPYEAEIQVGIPGFHAPADRVEVALSITDVHGKASPKALERQVFIDGKPSQVNWRADGASSRAMVKLPPGAGPWRLKVQCSDSLGVVAQRTQKISAIPGGSKKALAQKR